MVWAVKDPTSSNLDRIQVVKGWSKNGQSFEKVYDAVWAGNRKPDPVTGKVPAIGTTVDIADASFTNTIGAVELKGSWTDPDFNPADDAFYYARVIAIPTPRWTTIQAKELGISPPEMVAASVQERAWSSNRTDAHLAARSNEFGYANYEIVSTPVFLGTEVEDPTVPQ